MKQSHKQTSGTIDNQVKLIHNCRTNNA